MKKLAVTLLFSLLSIHSAFAQAIDCPAIVKAALNEVDSACADMSRNQLCYGNITLSAMPRAGISNINFEKAGDRVSVTDVQSLQLSSMSVTDSSWGVALMELQANLPDTLPGQNVTFLLFGDVQIENKAADTTEVIMSTSHNVNVRLRPTTTGNNIMLSLKAGEPVIAIGRLADSSWVRIKVKGDTRSFGWVATDYVKGDLSKLSVVQTDTPAWGPMQAFYFKTGVGDRPCEQAPDSGILIQTPKGSGKVILNVNDVEIKLGSTVYLQAQPSSLMTVTVLEGQATLQTGSQTQIVPAGTYSQVNLDASGHATGSASFPRPYDAEPLQTLPLTLKVFDTVEIATPLTAAQIKATLEPVMSPTAQSAAPVNNGNAVQNSNLPLSTTWYQTHTVTTNTCDPSKPGNAVGDVGHYNVTLTLNEKRDQLVWGGWETLNLGRVSDNTYQGTVDNGHRTVTLTFTSSTSYNFTWDGDYGAYNGTPACRYIMHGSGNFQG